MESIKKLMSLILFFIARLNGLVYDLNTNVGKENLSVPISAVISQQITRNYRYLGLSSTRVCNILVRNRFNIFIHCNEL